MMDAATFTDLVRGKLPIDHLAYQDLLEAAEAYPYCRNLHDLLLLKARQLENSGEDGPEKAAADRLLEKAAAYSIDRPYLFERLQVYEDQAVRKAEADEPLSLDALHETTDPEPKHIHAPAIPQERIAKDFAALLGGLPQPSPAAPISRALPAGLLAAYARCLQAVPVAPPAKKPETDIPARHPQNKAAFRSWKISISPAGKVAAPQLRLAPEKKKTDEKAGEVVALAEQSLQENEEVVSETLATLLVRQQRYRKAIQVYERLRLKYPGKSAYFAQIIETLKKYP